MTLGGAMGLGAAAAEAAAARGGWLTGRLLLAALLPFMAFTRLAPRFLMAAMGLLPPDLSVALKPAVALKPIMDLQRDRHQDKTQAKTLQVAHGFAENDSFPHIQACSS